MNNHCIAWKNILFELNDFSCKVEFLQSRLRRIVAEKNYTNIKAYLNSLKNLISEHEENLKQISINNPNLVHSFNENERTNIKNNIMKKEIFDVKPSRTNC